MPYSKGPGGMLSLRDIVPSKDPDCASESVRDPYQHVGDEFDLLVRGLGSIGHVGGDPYGLLDR